MEVVQNFVGSYGFPIAAFLLMFYEMRSTRQDYQKQLEEADKRHDEEISKITEALNNNTHILELIEAKLNVQ